MLPPVTHIQSVKDALRFLARVFPQGPDEPPSPDWSLVGLDTEFTFDEEGFEFGYLQLATDKEIVVVEGPLTQRAAGQSPLKQDLIPILAPILTHKGINKAISTTRADVPRLKAAYGIKVAPIYLDTEVCDWLYDENRTFHGLKDTASDHLSIPMDDYGRLFRYHPPLQRGGVSVRDQVAPLAMVVEGNDGPNKFPVPWTGAEGRKKVSAYAAKDPWATFKLAGFYERELTRLGLWEWYCKVERPLTSVLISMEERGILIAADRVNAIRRKVFAELLRLEAVVRLSTGRPDLNLRSVPQLNDLIFNQLKWPVIHRNELTESQEEKGQEAGNPSLAAWVLDEYVAKGYTLASFLRLHRSRSTLHNTFLTGALLKRDLTTDRIHTVFKQTRTVTGRLASGDAQAGKMNLQNIPVLKEKDPFRLRQFFVAPPGHLLIIGDYVQIELYILAELSGDQRLIQAFSRNEDVHMLTAAQIFGLKLPKEPKDWTPGSKSHTRWLHECEEWKERYGDKRKLAKPVNFGIVYGMSAHKLSGDLGIEVTEAEEYIEGYFTLYPGVRRYIQESIDSAGANGYVTTISGRPRRLPDIHHHDRAIRGHAERQAVNARIQGSAADIIKVAMVLIELGNMDELAAAKLIKVTPRLLEARRAWIASGGRLLLQVHDELLAEVPEATAKDAAVAFRTLMEAPLPYAFKHVTYSASVAVGPSWDSKK